MRAAPTLLRRDGRCLTCDHPYSALTPAALVDAEIEHARFIIATRDPGTDPHFEDARLTALVEL